MSYTLTPYCHNCLKSILYPREKDVKFCSALCQKVYEIGQKSIDNLHRISSEKEIRVSRSPTNDTNINFMKKKEIK